MLAKPNDQSEHFELHGPGRRANGRQALKKETQSAADPRPVVWEKIHKDIIPKTLWQMWFLSRHFK